MPLLRTFSATLLFVILYQTAYAADTPFKEVKVLSLKRAFATAGDWHVTAWQSSDKDFATGDTPAKLCFWTSQADQQKLCTSITSALPNDGLVYRYQSVRGLEVVHPYASNPSVALLKFSARFFGGGSGYLDQISFWRYDKKLDAFEPSSHITLTEQGEHHLSDKGTLITADAVSQAGETHFSPHHFYVEAYRYEADTGYVKMLGYLTSVKYPSFDDAEKIDVIAPEMPRIESLLATIDAKTEK